MRLIFSLIILFLLFNCNNNEDFLKFQRITNFRNIEIDTIEKCFKDSFYVINIIKKGFLGNFEICCGFVLNINDTSFIYEAIDLNEFRISKNFIAKIESNYFGKENWGWFCFDDNGNKSSLPNESFLLDSLKEVYEKNNYFVNSNNTGEFFIYKEGKVVNILNYGDLIINDNKIEFDKLENMIYKIDGKELKSIKFTNNLEFSNLKGGTFFIAKPGLGVKQRYSKYEIFQTLLSLNDTN